MSEPRGKLEGWEEDFGGDFTVVLDNGRKLKFSSSTSSTSLKRLTQALLLEYFLKPASEGKDLVDMMVALREGIGGLVKKLEVQQLRAMVCGTLIKLIREELERMVKRAKRSGATHFQVVRK